ncbi:uncharacterized protein BP01DRAFT_120587 [Aspergillus saccharolyticus JOP 1030-1]|uniref:Uncharacterized protein n=1 Tax=Aspergillus saccharolyticus JOP 1030-1 TaxID=1450539 RepID=A0A318ZNG1_9EURO|nr:hypothetical protein BP01DRAFT_120587 [Aspergillus saccharolyticus JOP 1030-1]PYH49076.1 hypothetical protein BP01DRAFT_120587 [Aspergillus saccharolyticus JOP 1030-1]
MSITETREDTTSSIAIFPCSFQSHLFVRFRPCLKSIPWFPSQLICSNTCLSFCLCASAAEPELPSFEMIRSSSPGAVGCLALSLLLQCLMTGGRNKGRLRTTRNRQCSIL